MSTYINNKLFTYVASYQSAIDNASLIKNNYPNSLVFIGDERIIWQPLTNSYIGLGSTAYSYLNTWINNTYAYAETAHQRLTVDTINGISPAANNNITFNTSRTDLAIFKEDLSNSNTIQLNLDGLNTKLDSQGLNSKAFAVENTTKQINTLYQLLLGSDKNPEDIYVEHELDHFIDPATHETFDGAGLFIDTDGTPTYKSVKLSYDSTNNQYQIIDAINPSTVYETFTSDSNGNITVVSGPTEHDHGTETIGSGITYVVYSRPTGNTSSYTNYSIVDSIDTINEIAYILDKITDGDTTGISLAYNIAETYTGLQTEIADRKDEDTNIRKEMVKGVSISGNPYLNVVELNSYTYNGLKTGAITSQLSINVAEAVNHQVGWFDSSDNWHWIYEDHSTYAYTQALQVAPVNIDNETLKYYFDKEPGTYDEYIVVHASNDSGNALDSNSILYTFNTFTQTFTKNTSATTLPNEKCIEVKSYVDKYEYANGNLSNGDKLLTTVDWVSSYVAVLKNEFDALDVDNDISSYLTDNVKFPKITYDISKDSHDSTYYSIITSLTPVIDNNGIKVEATYIPITRDLINIDIVQNNDTTKPFNVSYTSALTTNANAFTYTTHNIQLSYALLTDTLATPSSLTAAGWNNYDGFASAHDVSQTFTNMFTWYNAVDGTVYGS